jgi:hypothetical protein
MIKRFKKANALILTTVILFAVATIAAGITMYFYRAALLTKNTNVYYQKHIDLENEFNKYFRIVLDNELEDSQGVRSYFTTPAEPTKAFLEGDYYSTIKREFDGSMYTFSYEIQTASGRRECHLIKTIYKTDGVFTVDPHEVYNVTIIN